MTQLEKRADGLPATKWSILKVVAGLYELLGVTGPVVVCVRVLFQELCANKVDLDDELKDEERKRWIGWLDDLRTTREVSVPRCVCHMYRGHVNSSLYGFADASIKAYCAVVSFMCEAYGAVHVTPLTSKTRVAPLKKLTIPRLELISGRTLARLVDRVKNALKEEVHITGMCQWLDSKRALWWINNKGEWKQLIRQHVNEVLRMMRKEDWEHCPGEQNPTDVGSRGEQALKLKENELWWKGPSWLSRPKDAWPVSKICETSESTEEEKKVIVTLTNMEPKGEISNVIDIERFSQLGKLLRVNASVRQFLHNVGTAKIGAKGRVGVLQGKEMVDAQRAWIEFAQAELKRSRNYEDLANNLKLYDCNGILRCSGRLQNSDLEPEAQHPIVIPRDHEFTGLHQRMPQKSASQWSPVNSWRTEVAILGPKG